MAMMQRTLFYLGCHRYSQEKTLGNGETTVVNMASHWFGTAQVADTGDVHENAIKCGGDVFVTHVQKARPFHLTLTGRCESAPVEIGSEVRIAFKEKDFHDSVEWGGIVLPPRTVIINAKIVE